MEARLAEEVSDRTPLVTQSIKCFLSGQIMQTFTVWYFISFKEPPPGHEFIPA
jgi:hypothetical protein